MGRRNFRSAALTGGLFSTIVFAAWQYTMNAHFFGQQVPNGPVFKCNNPVTVEDTSSNYHSYSDTVDFRIIVMSFDRAYSLEKSLLSLMDMILDGHKAAVEIWIDRSIDGTIDALSEETAVRFCWNKGPVRVHLHKHHVGLYGNWIRTWRPRVAVGEDRQELGVLVEDDVDLSNYAYRFLRKLHNFYGDRNDINGYTLYEQNKVWFNSSKDEAQFHSQGNDKIVFNYRILGTWGFAPHPLRWREFQDWFQVKYADKSYVPLVKENPIHSSWYKDSMDENGEETSMWEMWFIKFTYDRNMFSLHYRIGEVFGRRDTPLANCRKEQGLHMTGLQWHFMAEPLMTTWDESYVNFNKFVNCYHVNGSLAWVQ